MKILLTQAKRSEDIDLMKKQMELHDTDIVVFPEGYISNEELLEEACDLAKEYSRPILSSYLDNRNRKDMAVVIDERGNKVLHRKKSLIDGPLLTPSVAEVNGMNVGYMLCCEVFLNNIDFSGVEVIFNPIGVGMFSEEQFSEWSGRARELATQHGCYVIGASHADGSFRNCGTSIPIAYVYDKNGDEVYLSKNDTRSVIVDTEKRNAEYAS